MLTRLLQDINSKKVIRLTALVAGVGFAGYYCILLYCRVSTDIQEHAAVAYAFAVKHDKLSPNFLYFFLVALLAGFSSHYPLYYVSSILLLAGSVMYKFLLNTRYISKYAGLDKQPLIVAGLSVMMLFVFALPGLNFIRDKDFYLGQLAPNVWHNSTVIFLMPFALLLFFASYESVVARDSDQPKNRWLWILILILINVLIKPSFLFTLLPSVFLFFLYDKYVSHKREVFYKMLVPYIAGIAGIVLEYCIIYRLNYASSVAGSESSKIIVSPFTVWDHFSPNTVIAVITSLLFPLLYLIITKGAPLRNRLVQFAGLNFVIGLAIWILFAEEGSRIFHGNFYWQVVVTTYLLFFCLLTDGVKRARAGELSPVQRYIAGGAFLLHFVWGGFYWLKIIIFNGYS